MQRIVLQNNHSPKEDSSDKVDDEPGSSLRSTAYKTISPPWPVTISAIDSTSTPKEDVLPHPIPLSLFRLELLFESTNPQIDLIIFYAEEENAIITWKSGERTQTHSRPQELLPLDSSFRNTRIHSLGYNRALTSENAADLYFRYHLKCLIGEVLALKCINQCSTPIILVADSLSQLLLKRAYVHWRRQTKDKLFFTRIQAMVFLATPIASNDFARSLAQIFEASSMAMQKLYLDDLSPAFLDTQGGINQEFRHSVDPLRLHVFYDRIDAYLNSPPSSMVTQKLAILGFANGRSSCISIRTSFAALILSRFEHLTPQLALILKESRGCFSCHSMVETWIQSLSRASGSDRGYPLENQKISYHDNKQCLFAFSRPRPEKDTAFSNIEYSLFRTKLRYWRYAEPTITTTLSFDITGLLKPWYADPNSMASFVLISRWIGNCLRDHQSCKVSSQEMSLPTRLLDLGLKDQNKVRIVSTASMRTLDKRYVALSYCWGSAMPRAALTTAASLRCHIPYIRVASLPKTFIDVIRLTRMLGIQYLWIDSLCIIQDSKSDWHLESARMGLVYSNATFTIAAAAADDCSKGLFAARDHRANESSIINLSENDGTKLRKNRQAVFFRYDPSWQVAYDGSPLTKRGWTLQERELSPRNILYTKHQILWECRTLRASEIAPNGYPQDWLFLSPGEEDRRRLRILDQVPPVSNATESEFLPELACKGNDIWHRMIEDFSSRQLTKVTDKFPALSGLATEFQTLYGGTYIAGLWEEDIIRDLLWHRHPAELATQSPKQIMDVNKYIAPSWSWASVRGRVSYNMLDQSWPSHGWVFGNRHRYGNADSHFERPIIEQIKVVNVGPNPKGQLSGGFIKLRGRIKACPIPKGTNFSIDESPSTGHFDVDLDSPRDKSLVKMTVLRVFTTPFNPKWQGDHPGLGLALQPTLSGNEFRRIGLVSGVSRAWFDDGMDMSITII